MCWEGCEEGSSRAKNKASEKHKGQLAYEYTEAAKESTGVYKDLQGTFNDSLYEIKDVADLKRKGSMFDAGLIDSSPSPKCGSVDYAR